MLTAFVGIEVETFLGIKNHLVAHTAHDAYAVELMTVGVALELVVQGTHIVFPHHLGNLHGHTLAFGNLAYDGLVAILGTRHHHGAAGGIIYARFGIVMGTHSTARKRSHAGEFHYISFFDEFYDKVSYIHRVYYFFLFSKYCSAAARSSGVSIPILACSVAHTRMV